MKDLKKQHNLKNLLSRVMYRIDENKIKKVMRSKHTSDNPNSVPDDIQSNA